MLRYRGALLKIYKNVITTKRFYCDKNILNLTKRGYFKDIFPDNAHSQISQILAKSPQTIYAGFDPTANSLHIGNLLVIMGLLHCQRAGHTPLALIGGATGHIGDPSGRTSERTKLENTIIEHNVQSIHSQIETIFQNHAELLWNKPEELKPVKILNNYDWYKDFNLIAFISTFGRHFRLGQMLSRTSVQSRLQNDSGLSFTEFTYQVFQAYDWLYLLKTHDCRFQMGGSDQTGNIMTGHELISRLDKRLVYGLTLPLVTTETGDKFGKSAGNAVWLNEQKTSAFSLYQFFIRTTDAEVEKLLKLFTFIPINVVHEIMTENKKSPEKRVAQKRLAEEVCLLVYGKTGLKSAENITNALYKGSVDALGDLTTNEIKQTFASASYSELLLEPGLTVFDVAMKAKCFPTDTDAMRIISAGGLYINQKRASNTSEILTPGIHILNNGLTLIRVGKKNYYIIKWLA